MRVVTDEFCGDRHPRYALMCELGTRDCRMGWFRHRLYERDGGTCQLCGHPVCSSAFQLDHIVPKRDGGPFTWMNLRLAHKRCNASRAAGNRSTPAIDDSKKNGPPPERYTEDEEASLEYHVALVRRLQLCDT